MPGWIKKIQHVYQSMFSGYYNILLILLVLLFIFRPHGNGFLHLAIWQLILSCALLSTIFNANHARSVKLLVSILAVPTVLLCWVNLIHHNSAVFIVNVGFIILFLTIVTGSVVYNVVLRARVTLETLRGVICAYFMVAFLFAYLFYLIEFIYPNSFYLISRAPSSFSYAEYLSELIYFSYITLLTVGFGDITPIKSVSQTFVVIEGIIGQFYIAILVARIVSIYALFSDKRLLNTLEHDIGLIRKKKNRRSRQAAP